MFQIKAAITQATVVHPQSNLIPNLPPLPPVTELRDLDGSRVLLVVDVQYLTKGAKTHGYGARADRLLDRVRAAAGPQGSVEAIACFLMKPETTSLLLYDALLRSGFEVMVVQSARTRHPKEDVDIQVTRAILRMSPEVDHLVLVTGDYMPADDIRWKKARQPFEATVVSYPSSTSEELVEACDHAFSIGADLLVTKRDPQPDPAPNLHLLRSRSQFGTRRT